MKKELIGLGIVAFALIGVIGVAAAFFALISLANSVAWPGAIALALMFPFVSGATLFFYCVGALVAASSANEKIQNGSLHPSLFFWYVCKMNLLAFIISLVLSILLQVLFIL